MPRSQSSGTSVTITDPQESVLSINTAPPGSPADGARYLCDSAGCTGDFASKEDKIAEYTDGSWNFTDPSEGMLVFIEDITAYRLYKSGAWAAYPQYSDLTGSPWAVAGGVLGTDTSISNEIRLETSGASDRIFEKSSDGKEVTKTLQTVDTSDATVTDLYQIAVAEGECFFVRAIVEARESDGSNRGMFILNGNFYRNAAGNVTVQGDIVTFIECSDANWDVNLTANTSNQSVDVEVTGVAATDITWTGRITYFKV